MLVLLDLDGTLTDPYDGITRSVAYALEGLGLPRLDDRVAALLEQWPDLNIDLVRGDGICVEPDTDRPTISIIVADTEARPRTRLDIASRTLVTEPYVSVTPSTGRTVRLPTDLPSLDPRAIITTDSPGTLCHQLLERAFERAGIIDMGWVHVPGTTTAVELALAGFGVAVLPRSASIGLADRGDLCGLFTKRGVVGV